MIRGTLEHWNRTIELGQEHIELVRDDCRSPDGTYRDARRSNHDHPPKLWISATDLILCVC